MSADARVARAIIALRDAIAAGDAQIPRDTEGRAPAWWLHLDVSVQDLCDEARDAINMTDEDIESWRKCDASLRWKCGCLINQAGAHRVGCPDHPEGVRP